MNVKEELYKKRIQEIESLKDIKLKKLLIFYLQTSAYTYLGPYSDFTRTLPDDIEELCILQRTQTIHARELFFNKNIREEKNSPNGDMSKVPVDRFNNEEDIFQTAISIFAELLRRDRNYSIHREAKNKIHIVCRGHSLMLASTLKSKGIPARVRVGFAKYHSNLKECDDQWNVEWYNLEEKRWKMVDAAGIGGYNTIQNEITDIPKEEFITAAESWKQLRNNTMPKGIKIIDSAGYDGLKASWLQLMNDFNCLMNNEKSFLFQPTYMYECKNDKYTIRDFTNEELQELDELAELMLDCDNNLDKLYKIYLKKPKFRIMLGISIWN